MDVTPILPVLNMDESTAFYRAAGFHVHVYGDDHENGQYAFVHFDDVSVFDLRVEEPATGSGCYVRVPDPDDWHTRLEGLGYDVSDVKVEPWGMREFALADPNGNRLRFGRSAG
jgi:catechol 2,3-dioxygenase-like lactoylglutathione lyase family enzyme